MEIAISLYFMLQLSTHRLHIYDPDTHHTVACSANAKCGLPCIITVPIKNILPNTRLWYPERQSVAGTSPDLCCFYITASLQALQKQFVVLVSQWLKINFLVRRVGRESDLLETV